MGAPCRGGCTGRIGRARPCAGPAPCRPLGASWSWGGGRGSPWGGGRRWGGGAGAGRGGGGIMAGGGGGGFALTGGAVRLRAMVDSRWVLPVVWVGRGRQDVPFPPAMRVEAFLTASDQPGRANYP